MVRAFYNRRYYERFYIVKETLVTGIAPDGGDAIKTTYYTGKGLTGWTNSLEDDGIKVYKLKPSAKRKRDKLAGKYVTPGVCIRVVGYQAP